mmetsp:Transcript_49058/g.56390  ORF Transcript_49058/g.56390 Transcript_49058/m.56390 type:complete len:536 (+) Transcript_49058:80-1687(+)
MEPLLEGDLEELLDLLEFYFRDVRDLGKLQQSRENLPEKEYDELRRTFHDNGFTNNDSELRIFETYRNCDPAGVPVESLQQLISYFERVRKTSSYQYYLDTEHEELDDITLCDFGFQAGLNKNEKIAWYDRWYDLYSTGKHKLHTKLLMKLWDKNFKEDIWGEVRLEHASEKYLYMEELKFSRKQKESMFEYCVQVINLETDQEEQCFGAKGGKRLCNPDEDPNKESIIWGEQWRIHPDDSFVEKWWQESDGNSWGTKEGYHETADHLWQESWYKNCQNDEYLEKWNKIGERKWGEITFKDHRGGEDRKKWSVSQEGHTEDDEWHKVHDQDVRWGVKKIVRDKYFLHERWEEKGVEFKIWRSEDNGQGLKLEEHAGHAKQEDGSLVHQFSDKNYEEVATGRKYTVRDGYDKSTGNEWSGQFWEFGSRNEYWMEEVKSDRLFQKVCHKSTTQQSGKEWSETWGKTLQENRLEDWCSKWCSEGQNRYGESWGKEVDLSSNDAKLWDEKWENEEVQKTEEKKVLLDDEIQAMLQTATG